MNTRFKDIGIYSGTLRPGYHFYTKSGYQSIVYAMLNANMDIFFVQLVRGVETVVYETSVSHSLLSYNVVNNIAEFTSLETASNVRYFYITMPAT